MEMILLVGLFLTLFLCVTGMFLITIVYLMRKDKAQLEDFDGEIDKFLMLTGVDSN